MVDYAGEECSLSIEVAVLDYHFGMGTDAAVDSSNNPFADHYSCYYCIDYCMVHCRAFHLDISLDIHLDCPCIRLRACLDIGLLDPL